MEWDTHIAAARIDLDSIRPSIVRQPAPQDSSRRPSNSAMPSESTPRSTNAESKSIGPTEPVTVATARTRHAAARATASPISCCS